MRQHFETVDEYLSTFEGETKTVLQNIRGIIKEEIPDSTEVISYQVPAYKKDGKIVIYFAGFKNHISLYPLPTGPAALLTKIKKHIKGKGTVSFPLNSPIPYELIREIVAARLKNALSKNND